MVLRTRFLSTVAAFGVLAIATGARTVQAQTTIMPGQSGIANPTGLAFYGGTQVGGTQSAGFTALAGAFTVNLVSAAFSGSATNLNGLDFYYQLQIGTNTGAAPITNLSLSQFSSLLSIAAGQTTDPIAVNIVGAQFASGAAASNISGTMARSNTALGFDYSSFVTGNSQTLVVRTNATATTTGTAALTAGNGIGTISPILGSVIVAADTPEPGTFALMGMGLASGSAGVAVRRRRRIAKK